MPPWYDPIRSLLPDGFDQIVLTEAVPEAVGFKAFRTNTRQLLDVSITLRPGVGIKGTSDAVTFTDEHGNYYESTSAVTPVTPDNRMVLVRCGLSPVGGGAVRSASMADSRRDYCGDGFDNLSLDPVSRRQFAARLADAHDTELTIIHGIWPPRAADAVPANALAAGGLRGSSTTTTWPSRS